MTQKNFPNKLIQNFIKSIKKGSVNEAKKFLLVYGSGLCHGISTVFKQTPLFFAAAIPDKRISFIMVKMLIQAGSNPIFKDSYDQTALFYACRDGKKQIVLYLLERGCKLSDKDIYGQTPLFYVARDNQLHLLDLFLKQIFSQVDILANQTALYYAAKNGHLEMCRILVERGCNPTHLDGINRTALHYANKHNHKTTAKYLEKSIENMLFFGKHVNYNDNRKKSFFEEPQKQKLLEKAAFRNNSHTNISPFSTDNVAGQMNFERKSLKVLTFLKLKNMKEENLRLKVNYGIEDQRKDIFQGI